MYMPQSALLNSPKGACPNTNHVGDYSVFCELIHLSVEYTGDC